MPVNNIKMSGNVDGVYQIRLRNELKGKFMESCHELALNPSAVLRMLMDEWIKKNQIEKKPQNKLNRRNAQS